MKILLISPKTPDTFWSFKHVLRFVAKKAAFPPLGLLTVAALLPKEWDLKLVDLNVDTLEDSDLLWADTVLLSAMIVQQDSVHEVVGRCVALNKRIIAGGPLFTTSHERFPGIEHFVLGEAEEIMAELVEDLRNGTLKPLYKATRFPELRLAPIPRYDLIRPSHYVTMAAQFSRGCPFDCEFCDIIVMNGRVPRTKSPEQFVEELEALRRIGWKDMVFVVDDNFIGNKPRTRALLEAMIEWRQRTRCGMGFFTEASINLADEPELIALMLRAGFRKVFVGIETPSKASLEECHKFQNSNRDLDAALRTLQTAGLEVMGGFIVGFDSDTADIFKQQFDFIQRTGVVTAMVGMLTALPQTRLYKRLHAEGRLLAESTGNNTLASLNFDPRMGKKYLEEGYRELMHRLYEPRNYYRRIGLFLRQYQAPRLRLRLSFADFQAFLKSLWLLGVSERGRLAYWKLFARTLLLKPSQLRMAIELAIIGYHFRRVAKGL